MATGKSWNLGKIGKIEPTKGEKLSFGPLKNVIEINYAGALKCATCSIIQAANFKKFFTPPFLEQATDSHN